ncbi:hypothetical protein TIFTF001_051194 [Ficus carica]|uniref:Uncharacterized protein n=1 Tax=Ficus carica TaxID=3494 RepID=A0AA88CIN9_FICCA|nr:hypothetical protein TIFTF001_051192 [Ficus carica]GMN22278.1 hypothetical protein TIFTF001_051193 [Ficus carica]GMN22283.1 hypothetical protein TIFTF001_051194 [Ficus carica]
MKRFISHAIVLYGRVTG